MNGTSTGSVSYTWDDNGNASTGSAHRLFNDGVNTYTYDPANRLATTINQQSQIENRYNGLGDRLQEIVNGQTTSFTMDLNPSTLLRAVSGLTQALSDGIYHYVYGNGRIAQVNTTAEYFLGDALGSVRQMTDTTGAITYARTYDPYGVIVLTGGVSQSVYGYTGEFQDSTGIVYLRRVITYLERGDS